MRNIVTFKSSFPESEKFDHPKGYSICNFLYSELANLDYKVKSPNNYRDIAWSVDCRINSKNVYFFVGYLGTKVTEWQLIICSTLGFIGWLLGRKDQEEQQKLAKAIHSILLRESRISEIKWFSRYTDNPKDVWFLKP